MQHTRSRGHSSSYTKTIIFAVILGLSIFIYKRVTPGRMQGILGVMDKEGASYARQELFDESQQALIQKRCAGFWELMPPAASGDLPFRLSDRMEIKDNGVVWRVKRYFFAAAPWQDTVVFMHVSHAFMRPFAWENRAESTMVCEAPIVLQAYAAGTDTCYAPKKLDELWTVRPSGSFLWIGENRYGRYDGAISGFFPPGALDIVEDVMVSECKSGYSFYSFAVNKTAGLVSSFQPEGAREPDHLAAYIDSFYIPLLRHAGALPEHYAQRKISVRLSIARDGTVREVKTVGRGAATPFARSIETIIKEWQFPFCMESGEPYSFTYNVSF